MKVYSWIALTFLITISSRAQTHDTTGAVTSGRRLSVFPSREYQPLVVSTTYAKEIVHVGIMENVAIRTPNLQMSAIEHEIGDLESRECGALKNRDTLALLNLWARDFTLEEKQNELVYERNGLKNYLSLSRMIEAITSMDSQTVMTSGYEMFREVREGWKIQPDSTRRFFHVWTKKNGAWKLTTKTTTGN